MRKSILAGVGLLALSVLPAATAAAQPGPARTEVRELAEFFRGRIVYVAADSVIVETVRPGYRSARGLVLCKAAVAVNRR